MSNPDEGRSHGASDFDRVLTSDDPRRAALQVFAARLSPELISPLLTGKFCEHLGSNICNGMWAQIVRNPTFASFPFGGAGRDPDGGAKFQCDEEKIAEQMRHGIGRFGWPEAEIGRMIESRADSLAHWWLKAGPREEVMTSPDAGPHGGRAQRVEVRGAGHGICQWMHLPLHRCRSYRWRVVARSNELKRLEITLAAEGAGAAAEVGPLSTRWQAFAGELELPASSPPEALYKLSLTAPAAGQFVVARVLLEPADAIGGADPDVIRLLKESRLPILRWPGGNFVSTYRWEDGIGPADARPTRPNLAWGGVEPNLFGSDEFVAFCRAVGCEPMICINAGDGTPEEAARWVEYCNGRGDSRQGARRAANGHPEPYRIRYWEVGNELYGRHQRGWTTAAGYADRYREFVEAMGAVDPAIEFIANGCACLATWRREDWNGRLLRDNRGLVRSISDHVLIGGTAPASADPLDLYRDSMAFPAAHERVYAELRDKMLAAGVSEPRMAITEMQLFSRVSPPQPGEAARLTRETLVSPATMAEGIYNTLFYHVAVRLAPFVEMITHSATVNHGGGLRKERERVYPNPCHHAQAMLAGFAGARHAAIELTAPTEKVPGLMPAAQTMKLTGVSLATVAAMAAVAKDGEVLISLAHRGTSGPVTVAVELRDFAAAASARVRLLSAEHPWDANTLDGPERIKPVERSIAVKDGRFEVALPLYSVAVVRVEAR